MASALEKEVLNALVKAGRTPSEAEVLLTKLKSKADFPLKTAIEVSTCGNFVAINPAVCTHKTPPKDGKLGAILVNFNSAEVWIPVSQLAPMTEVSDVGDRGILVVKKWIAEKTGWIHGKT